MPRLRVCGTFAIRSATGQPSFTDTPVPYEADLGEPSSHAMKLRTETLQSLQVGSQPIHEYPLTLPMFTVIYSKQQEVSTP